MLLNARVQFEVNDALVSVIMPACNSEKYITESIVSVLEQSYKNLELIIINDCSSDNTLEIIKTFAQKDDRVILINNDINVGCAESRNKGLLQVQGQYIAFIDSDDIWEKEKIEKQLSYIQEEESDMVFTAYEMIDVNGKHIKNRSTKRKIVLKDLLEENSIVFSTTFFAKKSIADICFKQEWYHEDYVFLLECLQKKLKILGLNEQLAKYRVHKDGRSFCKIKAAKHRWKIYRKFLNMSMIETAKYFTSYFMNGLKKYR